MKNLFYCARTGVARIPNDGPAMCCAYRASGTVVERSAKPLSYGRRTPGVMHPSCRRGSQMIFYIFFSSPSSMIHRRSSLVPLCLTPHTHTYTQREAPLARCLLVKSFHPLIPSPVEFIQGRLHFIQKLR